MRSARKTPFEYSDLLEFDVLLIGKRLPTSWMSGLPTSLDAAQWSAVRQKLSVLGLH